MNFTILSDDKRRIPLNMEQINAYASRWKPHTSFEIEIVRRTPKVSSAMRGYYFAEVVPKLGEYLGYDVDEILLLHRQLKITYFQHKATLLERLKLPPMTEDKHGIWRNVPSVFGNDSEIGIPEKVTFLDWVIRVAAKEGCYIENPKNQ